MRLASWFGKRHLRGARNVRASDGQATHINIPTIKHSSCDDAPTVFDNPSRPKQATKRPKVLAPCHDKHRATHIATYADKVA